MDGGEATVGLNLVDICTDDITFGTSPVNGNNAQTGIRNISIQNVRFDSISAVVKVSGAGTSLGYINGIGVVNCDFYQVDKIINADTAVIQDALVSNNRSHKSFANQAISALRVNRAVISNNQFANWYDRSVSPPSSGDCFGWVIDASYVNGVIISNNLFLHPKLGFLNIKSNSSDVIISNNITNSGWLFGSFCNFINGANVSDLQIRNNSFFGITPSVSVIAAVDPAKQSSPFSYTGNTSSYQISNTKSPISLSLKHGNSSVTATTSKSDISVSDGYCTIRCSVAAPNTGSGTISMSGFPAAAPDPNLSNVSASYSGGGVIYRTIGINGVSRVIVDSTTQSISFYDNNGGQISTSNTTGNYSIIFEVKYRVVS